jgi:hypothetical protein
VNDGARWSGHGNRSGGAARRSWERRGPARRLTPGLRGF